MFFLRVETLDRVSTVCAGEWPHARSNVSTTHHRLARTSSSVALAMGTLAKKRSSLAQVYSGQ